MSLGCNHVDGCIFGWREYSDSATSAAGIKLALHRLAEDRRHPVDIKRAFEAARGLEKMTKSYLSFDDKSDEAIFSSMYGVCAVIKTILDKDKTKDVVERIKHYSKQLYDVADNEPSAREKARELEKFFENIHAVADELSVLGMYDNPVVYIFGHLNLKR